MSSTASEAAPASPAPAEAPWGRLTAAPGLALLLLLGGAAAWGNRGQINPDGICYLQLASHLLRGDVVASISGYWSPLLVWLLAPLLALGLDRLVAARLALLLCAGAAVVASDRLARHLGLTPGPRAAAVATIALAVGELATRVITPDVLVGACLLAYAASATHPELLRCRRRAALTGALAGVSFLAKSFALPVVLLHLPAMILLRARRADPAVGRRDVARTLAVAMTALGVVALGWSGVLSLRFQRPTWSSSGAIAHAAVGPGVPVGSYRLPSGLQTPPPPHGSLWERPDLLDYPGWSPLDGPEARAHQLELVAFNGGSALRILRGWDALGLTLPALALAPLAALLARRHLGRRAPALADAALWVPASVALLIGLHLPIFLEERYVLTFLLPPLVLLLVGGALTAAAAFRARRGAGEARAGRLLAVTLVGLVCASFAVGPLRELIGRAREGDTGAGVRTLVGALREARVTGPLAQVVTERDSPLAWHLGQYAAFFLDDTYVGTLTLAEATDTDLLDRHGVGAVFVPRVEPTPADLGPRWELRCILGDPRGRRSEVFSRR
ncbi:MAG: hypothetical protein M9894_20235 [Planctomycetes bacterium]|nr:hypothetical protein [Planctomycetota bacterium]